jgi:hypothetical protein
MSQQPQQKLVILKASRANHSRPSHTPSQIKTSLPQTISLMSTMSNSRAENNPNHPPLILDKKQIIGEGNSNNSPMLSSRQSRNSRVSYNSIASMAKHKANHKLVNNAKIIEPLFEDPMYKAKKMKKERKQDIQKRFNDFAHPHHHHHHHHHHTPNKSNDATKNVASSHSGGGGPGSIEYKMARCNTSFIFDPNGRLSYWMSFVVSLAFLYNFWVIIYRYSFSEIDTNTRTYWFLLDYLADFLYFLDILFNLRTGFLEEGVLQTDSRRLRHYYMNTTKFYLDCLCLLPLDVLYLSIGYNSMLRCFRLVKIYRFWSFLDRTERHTNYPNVFRTFVMLHYLFAIFHWNACITYFISRYLSPDLMLKSYGGGVGIGAGGPVSYFSYVANPNQNSKLSINYENSFGSGWVSGVSSSSYYNNFRIKDASIQDDFIRLATTTKTTSTKSSLNNKMNKLLYKDSQHVDLLREYLKAVYLSTKIITLVSEIPNPKTSKDYMFAIVQLVLALIIFAAIIGHVGYIVINLGNARREFQCKFIF